MTATENKLLFMMQEQSYKFQQCLSSSITVHY